MEKKPKGDQTGDRTTSDLEITYKRQIQGFPGGSVVKNPPANAGDTSSIPDPGRSHVPWKKISPCATTIESVLQSPGTATAEPLCPNY